MNDLLQSLLTSSALEKLKHKRQQDLTFADACRFWTITANFRGQAVTERLAVVRTTLHAAERQAGVRGIEVSDGWLVSADEIAMLIELNDHLTERFARHIALLEGSD